MEKNALGTTGLQLAALAVGYVRVVASAASAVPQDFLYNILRLLPALYGNLLELKPYGEDAGATDYDNYDTGAILPQVTEEQYVAVSSAVAALLGQYDTYLDTPADASLSEQLADIYQTMADFATTVADAPAEAVPDVLADMKYRFHAYLADTICVAQRVANVIYQSKALLSE